MDGLANRLFIARDLIYHKPRPVSAADFTPLSRSPIQTFRILYHDADGVGGEVLWDGEKAEIIASPPRTMTQLLLTLAAVRVLRLFNDTAVEKMNCALGHPRKPVIVSHHANGRSSAMEIGQQFHYGLSIFTVEVTCRFVGQQD